MADAPVVDFRHTFTVLKAWTLGLCASCDAPLDPLGKLSLFCSEFCRQSAETIRYARGCEADGRAADPLVAEAIRTRLAHLVSGGYRRASRALPAPVRATVLSGNGGRCVTCDVAPAVEVDHIDGDSADRTNLQGLCGPCHRAKTSQRISPLTPADGEIAWKRAKELQHRIGAEQPLRLCDDSETWGTTWRRLKAETKSWAQLSSA